MLCAALALTLAGCAEEKEPMLDRTVTVETTAAQTGELSTESTYIGTISAEAPPAWSLWFPAMWRRSWSRW